MAPSDVTSFSITCSHSTNCNSLFDQSASTDSLNDFVFRREFVWQCFCYTQVSDTCDIFGVGQTKHFGISDIANWARAAPQRYCRTWRMNQCCMFLILITFMNGHCLGAQNPTVICDHLIPSVIEFKIELLHTNLFLQYLNAPSSSSAWSWSKWVRWITPLMSSTIGRTAGRRRGKFIPLSREPPFTSLMDMDVPFDFQIMAGLTITRDLLDETGWSNQGKPANHGKCSLVYKIKHVILCLIMYMWYLHFRIWYDLIILHLYRIWDAVRLSEICKVIPWSLLYLNECDLSTGQFWMWTFITWLYISRYNMNDEDMYLHRL